MILTLSIIAALGFAALFVHGGMLTPSAPYVTGRGQLGAGLMFRLVAECWTGFIGYTVSIMVAGAQVAKLIGV